MSVRGSERRYEDEIVEMNHQRTASAVSLPAIDRDSTIMSTKFHIPMSAMDVNLYSTKKTVAQGMLDIALLSANASQLKFVVNQGSERSFYYANLSVIIISIFLQIVTGCFLIITGRYNINKQHHQKKAEKFNNASVVCVFVITVLNVFIAAFTAQDTVQN